MRYGEFLITGGAGFIGSHLAEKLVSLGKKVTIVDNFNDYYNPDIKKHNLRMLMNHPNVEIIEADICNKVKMAEIFEALGKSFSENGAIVHLAARAGVRPSIQEPELYQETNVQGTFNLAELAKTHRVRKFVFASSSSVYGERRDSGSDVAFKETDNVSKPVSPYAATKVMGENMLHTYSYLYGLEVVALRFFTVYGPRQRPDLAIHKFTGLIEAGKPITVYGDGSARRDFTYIDDILQGILGAIAYEDFSGTPFDVFNLGESKTTTVLEMIAMIEDALGKKAQLRFEPQHPADVSLTYADVSKARERLGYNPGIQPEVGIPKFVRWYREYLQLSQTQVSFA
jgi:UDP-glucuronate 4-epimerase